MTEDRVAEEKGKLEALHFANKVRAEMYDHLEYENDARVDAAWMDAIIRVFMARQCPDCLYSPAAGHKS